MVLKLAALCLLIGVAQCRFTPMNAEYDARMQAHKLLRCWEPNHPEHPTGYQLSVPQYNFCSYMPSLSNPELYHVNGVDSESDEYSTIVKVFSDAEKTHAVLNLCLQEGFSLSGPEAPGQVSLRCLCKRDACNIPNTLTAFLDFNKDVIPPPPF